MITLRIERRTARVLGVIAIALTVRSEARASCSSLAFGQLARACDAGTSYCYVRSPGLNTTATILGSFWALGYGDPVPGPGNDNGSWPIAEQWLHTDASGTFLAGDWSDSRVDGCITSEISRRSPRASSSSPSSPAPPPSSRRVA